MKPFLILDVETDGLYGNVFAIGASLWNPRKLVNTYKVVFEGKAEIDKLESEFVKTNIVPTLGDLTEYDSRVSMLEAFWKVYLEYKDTANIIADFGVPCEAQLFRECIMLNREEREFQGPYPLLDFGTFLYAYNKDPDLDRQIESKCFTLSKHNPVHDTIMVGTILMNLINHRTQLINKKMLFRI